MNRCNIAVLEVTCTVTGEEHIVVARHDLTALSFYISHVLSSNEVPTRMKYVSSNHNHVCPEGVWY